MESILGPRVLLKPLLQEKTESGIILSGIAAYNAITGVVQKVGALDKLAKYIFDGDHILYNRHAAVVVKEGTEELHIVEEEHLFAVMVRAKEIN